MLQTVSQQVACCLQRVDFSAIWPGFHPVPFALYHDTQACLEGRLIPRPPEFQANTAIRWQAQHLAIWHLEGTPDPEVLSSNLVHEMFHAYQDSAGDTRFPDDLALLFSPTTLPFLSARLREGQLLAQALDAESPHEIRRLLSEFCALRRAGRDAPWFRQVCLAETAEGTAEYAGLQALEQLAPGKYQAALRRFQNTLREPGPLLLNLRRMAYFTGAICLIAAGRAGLELRHRLGGQGETLFELLARQLPPVPPEPVEPVPSLAALVRTQEREHRLLLRRFLDRGPLCKRGRFRICGYDPMNQFALAHQLFCTHFLILRDLDTGAEFQIQGPCLLDLAPGSFREATAVRFIPGAPGP